MNFEKKKIIILIGLTFFIARNASAQDHFKRFNDISFQRGFIEAILMEKAHWAPGSYGILVRNNQLWLTPPKGISPNKQKINEWLHKTPGLVSIHWRSSHLGKTVTLIKQQQQSKNHLHFSLDRFLPTGLLFRPLIADPKTPAFFVSYRSDQFQGQDWNIGAVGYGTTIGVYRWNHGPYGGQVQVGFTAGAFSQFDMSQNAPNLLNTDYTVGIPISWRRKSLSMRLSLIHQSSHLGPLFYKNLNPKNPAFSFEKLEFLVSKKWENWRIYGGGGTLMWTVPSSLRKPFVHMGFEYYGPDWKYNLQPVAGFDLKDQGYANWHPQASLKFGVQYGNTLTEKPVVRILMEYYSGPSPHGIFYPYFIRYEGIGLYMLY